jgi:hypothetical protein
MGQHQHHLDEEGAVVWSQSSISELARPLTTL